MSDVAIKILLDFAYILSIGIQTIYYNILVSFDYLADTYKVTNPSYLTSYALSNTTGFFDANFFGADFFDVCLSVIVSAIVSFVVKVVVGKVVAVVLSQ